jgi:hypothetical protein
MRHPPVAKRTLRRGQAGGQTRPAAALALVAAVLVAGCLPESLPREARDPTLVGIVETVEFHGPGLGATVTLSDGRTLVISREKSVAEAGIRPPDPRPGDLMLAGEHRAEPWQIFLQPGLRIGCYEAGGPSWIRDGRMLFRNTLRLPLAQGYDRGGPGRVDSYGGLSRFCVDSNGQVTAYVSP